MHFYLFGWFGAFWDCTNLSLHMQRISADTSSPEKPGDLNKSMCTQVGSQAITTVLDQLRSEMGLLLVHFEHIHP